MINKKRSGRAEGRLLEILENSTLEVREPVCKNFSSMWWLHVPDNVLRRTVKK